MGPRCSKNGFCRTRDIPDTIISKEERSQPHKSHAVGLGKVLHECTKLRARYTSRHSMGPNNPMVSGEILQDLIVH